MSGRDYGKITPAFWSGKTGRWLRQYPDAQRVAMYLLTCSHANMIGVFHCPPAYIANDVGMTAEGASKALQRLSEGDFCTFDADTDLLWVHEMARFQVGTELKKADNQVKSIAKLFESVPIGLIKLAFFERYSAAYHLERPAEFDEIGRVSKAPSKPLRSQEQEQEQEEEQYQEQDSSGSDDPSHGHPGEKAVGQQLVLTAEVTPTRRAKTGNAVSADILQAFDVFWGLYPQKKKPSRLRLRRSPRSRNPTAWRSTTS